MSINERQKNQSLVAVPVDPDAAVADMWTEMLPAPVVAVAAAADHVDEVVDARAADVGADAVEVREDPILPTRLRRVLPAPTLRKKVPLELEPMSPKKPLVCRPSRRECLRRSRAREPRKVHGPKRLQNPSHQPLLLLLLLLLPFHRCQNQRQPLLLQLSLLPQSR